MTMTTALLIALQAAPPAFEDLAALEARVAAAAGAAIGAPGGPVHGLDRRLRLQRCPVAAEIVPARGGLAVHCPARGWRLHVALAGGAVAAGHAAGPVIRRGDPVLIRITGRGYAVGVRAVALEDGAVGTRIRLRRSAGPATTLIGIVTGPGEAAPAT